LTADRSSSSKWEKRERTEKHHQSNKGFVNWLPTAAPISSGCSSSVTCRWKRKQIVSTRTGGNAGRRASFTCNLGLRGNSKDR